MDAIIPLCPQLQAATIVLYAYVDDARWLYVLGPTSQHVDPFDASSVFHCRRCNPTSFSPLEGIFFG